MTFLKTNKAFGLLFSIIFLGLFLYLDNTLSKILSLILFLITLILSLLFSSLLSKPKKYWILFGYFIGKVISPIIISFIYFLVVFPTNIILKIFNKDILDKNFKPYKKSYWVKKSNDIDMEQQF
tara:strand:- start:2068 stop:2439 length:372 start_codon:yes stop_codon:yes gene_type:complete